MDIKITGIDNVLSTLKKLPKEVASKRGGPVLKSLRKGAKVFRDQAKSNLMAVHSPDTALLSKALVTRRAKTSNNGERVSVRVSRKIYPNRVARKAKGMPDTTLKSGQILEYGSSKQKPRPWLRPAFASKKGEALETVRKDLIKQVDVLATKFLEGG